MDVFLVAGQSNAEGRGSSAQSPTVSNGSVMYSGGVVAPLADPVGGAASGSAWPAFANTYGQCAVTEAANGGARLLTGMGGGNWSPSGLLFAAAITHLDAAVAALATAGHSPVVRGVLWSQGESEGELWPGTAADLAVAYEAGLVDLFDRFRFELGDVDMWVARTGRLSSGDTALWTAVRDAQDAACAATDGLHMAFAGAVDFPDQGMMKVDGIHYAQAGLNAMGAAMGAAAKGDDPPPEPTTITARVDGENVPITTARVNGETVPVDQVLRTEP